MEHYFMKRDRTVFNKSNRKLLLILLIIAILIVLIRGIFFNTPELGEFKTFEYENQYNKAYDKVLKLNPPNETYDIETSFGLVRVYSWGDSIGVPMFLLPGHSSGAPMWIDNVKDFSKKNKVYAIDALGDAGKSVQYVPLKDVSDVSAYLKEVMDELKLDKVNLIGHSFGGGYAANFALSYPEKLNSLVLLEPALALNYPSVSILFWATISNIDFFPKLIRDYGLSKISNEDVSDISSDDPLATMISIASSGYDSELPTPKTLSKDDIKSLNIPVYVAIADNSSITSEETLENAKLFLKGEVKVYENTTHSLPMEVSSELSDDLNKFWSK